MTSNKIEELKRRRQKEYTKKKSQVKYGIIVLVIILLIFILIYSRNRINGFTWIIGILIGFTLQRSRFCFAAGFRDPFLVGSTSILKSIILGLIVTSIGFGIIQYTYLKNNPLDLNIIPGQIYPLGTNTIIGAILFGIGMVIAGGCASGTLMRIGEGFILQLVVLFGFIIGTILGAKNFSFWNKMNFFNTTIYLPSIFNIVYVIIGQVIILIALYLVAYWYHKKKNIMI